jgi:predicted site-specific integrase-resolvase
MHFYSMQPSEYDQLDVHQRHDLHVHVERIRARHRLEFIADVGSLLADDRQDAQKYLAALAQAAYPFDDENDRLATILEAVTR